MKFLKTLVIVESPTKCKKIEEYLGCGYKVIATCGHLRELTSLSQINMETFKPSYSIIEKKKYQIKMIKKEIISAEEVILATDDDREGEAIAWHICDLFSLSLEETKRIKFSEITENAILRAIHNPEKINMNLVFSQQARQMIDLMIGHMLSPFLWEKIPYHSKQIISAGRCQTPTLRLIYENKLLREKSSEKMIYSIQGTFTNLFTSFDLNKHYDTKEEVITFLEQSYIHQHNIIVTKIDKLERTPPTPFTTSLLLQKSSYSSKETMKICQNLYELGYITYLRTDSTNYSKEFMNIIQQFILKKYNNEKYIGNVKLGITKAHEPIRPTNIFLEELPSSFEPKERKVYKIIWENTLESCMSSSIYNTLHISISAPFDLKYQKVFKNILFDGWEKVKGYNYSKEIKEYNYFSLYKEGKLLNYKNIVSKCIFTDTHPYYNEASLISQLEKYEIGRPSTFSSLIDKIQERKYAVKQDISFPPSECIEHEMIENNIKEHFIKKERNKEKNKLQIQPIGEGILKYLLEDFSLLFDYEYTKKMESMLDEITTGNISLKEVCKECYADIQNKIISKKVCFIDEKRETSDNSKIIRTINASLSIRKSKRGDYLYYKSSKMKKPKFYSLDDFKEDYKNCSLDALIQWSKEKLDP
jgi:DNA topoisomerase-1